MANSWSPDGRSIGGIFQSDAGGQVGPAIYDLESKKYVGPLEFRASGGESQNPAWLPDSSGFVFAGMDPSSGKEGLYLADRELCQVEGILSDTIRFPKVAPDGRWIYFNLKIVTADIWLLTFSEER